MIEEEAGLHDARHLRYRSALAARLGRVTNLQQLVAEVEQQPPVAVLVGRVDRGENRHYFV